jgi:hypothetical protein
MSGALWLASSLAAQTAPQPRILVYTRNYTPDGKGYVHDNIASSVAAIRKMGQESGFIVDVSDDPGVFTDGNLRQYAALADSWACTRLRDRSGTGLTSGLCWAANSRLIRTSRRSRYASSLQTSPL